MSELLEDLRTAAQSPMPAGFKPGIVYSGRQASEITTPWVDQDLNGATPEEWEEAVAALGIPVPAGHTLELVEARFNSAAWHRDSANTGAKHTAYTAPAWVYRFKVVPKGLREDEDLAAMMREAKKRGTLRKRRVDSDQTTMVVNLADFQVGKTDVRGGTRELLERSEAALAEVEARILRIKPSEIVLVDVGDSTEGFESSPNAARTNDLQQTEQIRVWRRIFWRWVEALSRANVPMKVVSVPSNHCRVRRGKDPQGPADDDWGLEVLSQLADMASVNPDRFGHVEFIAPNRHEEHVTLTLLGGKVISFAHGHQERQPNRLVEWAKRQGRRSVGVSDMVVVGHFHHLRVQAYGDGQTLFICPTMDPGSSWYTPSSGEDSQPGVLSFCVDADGWFGLDVAWL